MTKLDVTLHTKAADDLLLVTENPLHRQILENYRRHTLLEVTDQWELIFDPEMTVEHPVYFRNGEGFSETLDGAEAVRAFYKKVSETGNLVMILSDEMLAVADWGFATEAYINMYVTGESVPDGDPEKFYLIRKRKAMVWPYDERGRMIGEHVYEHADLNAIIELPENEFISLDEAKQKLIPLIRPLPALVLS